ncbi:hypothetical protein [Pseudomonas sp. H3(2019)]|uniref:hypothetical protein n=1 Tax=Pseudomonas sp. H3(2019) TaxID=2598724 RepID=UPI00118F9208|nr:hypothetical protein [Pseudomonas sp. H3(2019)]TVT80546.1 hypothetical protein FPT12_22510 [Pseudomonas sp. H3(2019)]
MDETEYANTASDFPNIIKEAKEEETGVWDNVKRVTSHSHVMIYFYNGTAETFNLTASSWDTGADPIERYAIAPWDYLSFVLREETPIFAKGRTSTQAKHSFTYKSENHTFEFSTLLKVRKDYSAFSFSPETFPVRENKIRSIGTSPLRCSSRIIRIVDSKPYHYGVVISLGGEY